MIEDVLALALALPRTEQRHLIALAGPPASGKSTLADAVAERLTQSGRRAAVLPMDGFHLGNHVLDQRGLRARKGAPETFDLDGLRAMLRRLADTPRLDIAIPRFDRGADLAEAGADIIDIETEIVIVEGNYLLLDRPGWRDLIDLWSASVLLSSEISILRERLTSRWADLPDEEAARKVEENDLPNARLVLSSSRPADICLSI
ncbi:MAG: nucleoside/nucleotide kinase family protein [Pseudomonadota bacterium]